MTRKYQGDPENPTCVSGYEWRYGDKLAAYLSSFPGESGAVAYDYGGDGKRRERTEGGNTTTYYWDAGWNQIGYKTYTGGKFTLVRDPASMGTRLLAKWNGTNPVGGGTIWRYYSQDNIGSTRMGTNDGKTTIKTYDYTPYGEIYSESGWAHTNFRFASAFWDGTTQMYYFPFRQYKPSVGRWVSRNPLSCVDGPNLYAYMNSNPTSTMDRLGLFVQKCSDGFVNCTDAGIWSRICGFCLERCLGQGAWPDTIELASRGTVSCGPGPDPEPCPERSPRFAPDLDLVLDVVGIIVVDLLTVIGVVMGAAGSRGPLADPAFVPGVIGPHTPYEVIG